MEAAMHGIKIPFKYSEENQRIEFTKEQDEILMIRLRQAQERKTSEMRAKNNG